MVQIQPRRLPRDALHCGKDTGPALKVSCPVGVEADDVAVLCYFCERKGFLEDNGRVSFVGAFYGEGEAGETGADDYEGDA